MKSLVAIVPDVEVLLALAPEELAFNLLNLGNENEQNGSFHPASFEPQTLEAHYPPQNRSQVEIAVGEALAWLTINMLIMPAPGFNGGNGHLVLTRRAREIIRNQTFTAFKQAASFPKSLLHPRIADKVWLDLARGDLEAAVFFAFKTIEIEIRSACGYDATEFGVKMMRKAFDKSSGPLTDLSQPEGERQALADLFAGAIGSYKNPHSHRTVTITDAREAQEMVMFASHLLRIVDQRKLSKIN